MSNGGNIVAKVTCLFRRVPRKSFAKSPVDNADYDEMLAEKSAVVMCLHFPVQWMMTMCLQADVLEPLRQMCLQSNEPVKPLQNCVLSAKCIDAKVG